MKNLVITLLEEIEKELAQLDQSHANPINFSHLAFEIYRYKSIIIKQSLYKHKFESVLAEIEFFKELKPQIDSKLIFYSYIFKIESKCSAYSLADKLELFHFEIEKIKRYFKSKQQYYIYYKTGNNCVDHAYFLRNNSIHGFIEFENNDFYYSTGHDKFFIKIKANEILLEYFQNRIQKISENDANLFSNLNSDLLWTADQIDMIELVYALIENKSVNHGDVTIKSLVSVLEVVFNFKITNKYRSFNELKNRHNPTDFLESCIDALTRRIDREL